jgi:hypothetical protein
VAFAKAHRLEAIATGLPWRGDADRLRTIAWWGSALADLVTAGRQADRNIILNESAAFNLAVALFDSVMECAPTQAVDLAKALTPHNTRARLFDPVRTQTKLRCRDPSSNLVASLFDSALSSAGQRLESVPADLECMAEQLAGMYRSEMGLSPDPFVAKSGPVVFIGALAGSLEAEPVRRLYQAMAQFCQLWDDWQDLEEDLRHLAPNSFLGAPRRTQSLRTFAYGMTSLKRVIGGQLMHHGIAETLVSGLRGILVAARECDRDTYTRTLALCRELLT